MHCIYLLLCPITREIRYVGKTQHPLEYRLARHLSEARRLKLAHRGAWIRSLLAKGLTPIICKDVDIPPGTSWEDVERDRIAFYRARGVRLVNGTDGGIGLKNPTAAVRAQMSSAERVFSERGLAAQIENAKRTGKKNKGKKRTPEQSALLSAQRKGRRPSVETRQKMSASRRLIVRKPWSQESRDKMSARLRGQKLSTEHRANISAGLFAYRRSTEPRA